MALDYLKDAHHILGLVLGFVSLNLKKTRALTSFQVQSERGFTGLKLETEANPES